MNNEDQPGPFEWPPHFPNEDRLFLQAVIERARPYTSLQHEEMNELFVQMTIQWGQKMLADQTRELSERSAHKPLTPEQDFQFDEMQHTQSQLVYGFLEIQAGLGLLRGNVTPEVALKSLKEAEQEMCVNIPRAMWLLYTKKDEDGFLRDYLQKHPLPDGRWPEWLLKPDES